MKTLKMLKMPFRTKHFNINQKVWVRRLSGTMAAEVKGRFRGKGRYVIARVKWEDKEVPEIKQIGVTDSFFYLVMVGVLYLEGY